MSDVVVGERNEIEEKKLGFGRNEELRISIERESLKLLHGDK